MATVQNITIDQGTTFSLTIALTNDDGTDKDLSVYTASAQMRKSYYTSTYTAFTTAKVDSEGELTISLTAAQTSDIKSGRYVYDIEIVSDTETLRILEGIVTVTPEVTK